MSSPFNRSNRIDHVIIENPDSTDNAMKNMVETLLKEDCKLFSNVFRTLCSQTICRPHTLRFLINHYRRTQTPDQKDLQWIMSDALRFFVKEWHECTPAQIRSMMHILLQNGADPFEKNRFHRDAFDYAHISGDRDVTTELLRTSPRNPIRRINQMIAKETGHARGRPYFVEYLQEAKRYFTDQRIFHQISAKTPFTSHLEKNI